MHLLDITMFYASESGGVKRYLSAKRDWLRRHTSVRHSLLVPAETDSDDGAGILTCASPAIPFTGGYHWPLRRERFMQRIVDLCPDVIESGDPYGLAWTALEAGQRLGVPVVGFYHSDLARLVSRRVGAWCEPAAARYVQRLYRRFDLVLAPSRIMADKLRAFGVSRVEQQNLGVDIHLFNPRWRDESLRGELGLPRETRLLIYAGRIAREKNLPVLMEAMQGLGPRYHLLVVGGGARPRPLPNVTFYPYLAEARELRCARARGRSGDLRPRGAGGHGLRPARDRSGGGGGARVARRRVRAARAAAGRRVARGGRRGLVPTRSRRNGTRCAPARRAAV